MQNQPPRGRGSRGRGTNPAAGRGQQQQPQRPGPQQQQPQQRPPQQRPPSATGAWGQPTAGPPGTAWPRAQFGPGQPQPPQQQPAQQQQQQQQRQPPPQATQPSYVGGRGGGEHSGAVAGAGTGMAASTASASSRGNGNSVRGKINRFTNILTTKPKTMNTKKGQSGNPVKLIANYFPLEHVGKWVLYQYRVDFNPDVDRTGTRRYLIKAAIAKKFTSGYLFDGTILYSTQQIMDPFQAFSEDERTGEKYRIDIRMVGDLQWGDYHYLQVFNIIIKNCLRSLGLTLVGRNYYSPDERTVFRDFNMELWPGYFTSMRQHESQIMLNCDMSFKFLRTDTVLDILMECQGPNARRDFQNQVIGTVVMTGYNRKTYKVDDIDFQNTPMSTFKRRDGSEITYVEYYRTRYGINIRNTGQPLLVTRSSKREIRAGCAETLVLIPELCQLTGLSDRQRQNFQLMKQLATFTRIGPDVRIRKLKEFAQKIHRTPEVIEDIRRWDLGIAQGLVEFEGRVLKAEVISGGASGTNNQYSAGREADWTKELRSRPMFYTPPLPLVIVITPSKWLKSVNDFYRMLKQAANGMKWNGLDRFDIVECNDDRVGSYLDAIEYCSKDDPKMILAILSNNSSDRYTAIKKKCCVDKGIPSQVILSRTLNNKGALSIATKVAIQMNCKIGGAPWSVPIPLSGLMVVGYDVCRDTVNKKKSFAGMVSSVDKRLTRYFNYVSEHINEEELSSNISAFMMLACREYHTQNGCFPAQILIYRDGVGDGQLPYVYEQEVVNVKRKLHDLYKDPARVKMAYIIVSKRINTRIFAGNSNPPPGTVVDDVITLPERYDFYIVSQCVRQGTVGPTSYNVIEDNMGLTPDRIQILTYKLTHMYYNWSGTVRVPAPCQYAHKLAFMVSQFLHRPAHVNLRTLLYYL